MKSLYEVSGYACGCDGEREGGYEVSVRACVRTGLVSAYRYEVSKFTRSVNGKVSSSKVAHLTT